jgi:hypothetical protein
VAARLLGLVLALLLGLAAGACGGKGSSNHGSSNPLTGPGGTIASTPTVPGGTET